MLVLASGTAGTTPFAANLNALSGVKKVLKDNGAPMGDLQLVMDTTAGANLFNLTQLTNADQAGDNANFLTQGMIGARPLNGFILRETGQAAVFADGVATGCNTTALEPVGEKSIAVDVTAGNSVALLAGHTITFAGQSHQYVVAADVNIAASNAGVILLTTGLKNSSSRQYLDH